MTNQEYIRILMLLSQLEGYIAGKNSSHSLPDYMSEELSEVCDMLAEHIKGE